MHVRTHLCPKRRAAVLEATDLARPRIGWQPPANWCHPERSEGSACARSSRSLAAFGMTARTVGRSPERGPEPHPDLRHRVGDHVVALRHLHEGVTTGNDTTVLAPARLEDHPTGPPARRQPVPPPVSRPE